MEAPACARPDDQNGIAGPLLRARVGDTLKIHFKNMDTEFGRPHSMHFHGVHYRVESDGAFIPGFSGRGANVKPGRHYTYTLQAERDSVGIWPYHDHSPSMHESIRAACTAPSRSPMPTNAARTASSSSTSQATWTS